MTGRAAEVASGAAARVHVLPAAWYRNNRTLTPCLWVFGPLGNAMDMYVAWRPDRHVQVWGRNCEQGAGPCVLHQLVQRCTWLHGKCVVSWRVAERAGSCGGIPSVVAGETLLQIELVVLQTERLRYRSIAAAMRVPSACFDTCHISALIAQRPRGEQAWSRQLHVHKEIPSCVQEFPGVPRTSG